MVGSARRLSMSGTAATPPEPAKSLAPLRRILHSIQLDMNAITQLTTMTLTGRQERPGFFSRFRLHAPFLQPRYDQGGVERFRACFRFGDKHPSLANQRDS